MGKGEPVQIRQVRRLGVAGNQGADSWVHKGREMHPDNFRAVAKGLRVGLIREDSGREEMDTPKAAEAEGSEEASGLEGEFITDVVRDMGRCLAGMNLAQS